MNTILCIVYSHIDRQFPEFHLLCFCYLLCIMLFIYSYFCYTFFFFSFFLNTWFSSFWNNGLRVVYFTICVHICLEFPFIFFFMNILIHNIYVQRIFKYSAQRVYVKPKRVFMDNIISFNRHFKTKRVHCKQTLTRRPSVVKNQKNQCTWTQWAKEKPRVAIWTESE